jgi:hypothetical protein
MSISPYSGIWSVSILPDTTTKEFDTHPATEPNFYHMALEKAVIVDNTVLIDHIVRNKSHDVNSVFNRSTALSTAIRSHRYNAVKQLISLGARLDIPCYFTTGNTGMTPLELAIKIIFPDTLAEDSDDAIVHDVDYMKELGRSKIIKLLLSYEDAVLDSDKLLHRHSLRFAMVFKDYFSEIKSIQKRAKEVATLPLPKELQSLILHYSIDDDQQPACDTVTNSLWNQKKS